MRLLSAKGFVVLLGLFWATVGVGQSSAGTNAPERIGEPYLILISIDGFRWDYQRRHDTPALDRIAADGVVADALVPVFPTLTFPSHYSIATGLYPVNHGLVGNRFPSEDRGRFFDLGDRASVEESSWYGGEPIWVAAERAGIVSAAYFFVGTEAAVGGVRPTYWKPYNGAISGARRVDQAIAWLSMPAAERPRLITLYFEDVDVASHEHGVDSAMNIAAIKRVDDYVARLHEGIAGLPIADQVTTVIVSDHGQSAYRRDEAPFVLEDVVDLSGIRTVDHGAVSFLYFDEPDSARAEDICAAINEQWRRGQAVTANGAPGAWNLRGGSRAADVIVQADPRSSVVSSHRRMRSLPKGDHGWAPEFRDMHGIFLARGPRIPEGQRIPPVSAVDVYPLMREILNLPPSDSIDGDPDRLLPLLLPP